MPLPDIQTVVNDPEFHALPRTEQANVLRQIDPDFKGLPGAEQGKVLDTFKTRFVAPQDSRAAFLAQETQDPNVNYPMAAHTPDEGKLQQGIIGLGAGLYDAYKGVQQLGATVGNKLGLVDQSTVDRIIQEGQQAREDFAPMKDQSTIANIGNFVGKAAPFVAIPGGVVGGFTTRLATSALAGAGMGASEFVPEGESRSANILKGAAAGAAGQAVLSGAGKVYNAIENNPLTQNMLAQLSEKFKIPATLSELNGTSNRTDTIMERVPSVFGITSFRKGQQEAAKEAATINFAKYVVDPTLDSSAAMKISNDAHIDQLYDVVRTTAKTLPTGTASETKQAAEELIQRFPTVFESVQDNEIKRVLSNIIGDTIDKTVKTGILDAQGNAIMQQVQPKISFDDLWTLRKGIGQALGSAQKTGNDVAASQYSRIYSAVSNDMDNMMNNAHGGVSTPFKEANDAFKQYSIKFDVMRQAYDKATGTTGAGTTGFFSPVKYATELKNLANNPEYKKNIKWSPTEVVEMTGLANILQVTKRAGQFMENPPTGNRWGGIVTGTGLGVGGMSAGIAPTLSAMGASGTAALITKFITTTKAGQRLALASSKAEANSKTMQTIINQLYNQLPKFAAEQSQ